MTNLSLRVRMVLVFAVLITVVAVLTIAFFPSRMAQQAEASAELRASTMARVMATALAPALEFDDTDYATRILGWLAATPDARFAVIVGDHDNRFAAWRPEYVPTELPGATIAVRDDVLVTRAPITGRGGGHGMLYVGLSRAQMLHDRDVARRTVVTASLIVLGVTLLACILLATALVRPIERLTGIARDIARGLRPPRISLIAGGREVAEMTDALGSMLDRLNQANRQLVDASRHAGMAEVATGVLHNVGNILTSVNVAIELLAERAHGLPSDRVRRAGELLARASTGGAIEPAKLDAATRYLAALGEHLASDRSALIDELDTLRTHVEHVKSVITMQNEFARVGDVLEHADLGALVDEALALACADPERYGIAIEREVEPDAHAKLDRHRVLQILVNLIANARDALTAWRASGGAGDLQLAVSARVVEQTVELAVRDTGSGIATQALDQIFQAGFTTKPKGHGYGLHSSALAAEAMGGSLECTSEGLGCGATFVLRVPVAETKQS